MLLLNLEFYFLTRYLFLEKNVDNTILYFKYKMTLLKVLNCSFAPVNCIPSSHIFKKSFSIFFHQTDK